MGGSTEQAGAARRPGLVHVALAATAGVLVAVAALAYAHGHETDLAVYQLGGRDVFGRALYSAHVDSAAGRLPFTYPPFAALLFWPLAHVDTVRAQTMWNLVQAVSLVGLVAVSIRAARGRRLDGRDWATALLLAAPAMFLWPVRADFGLGQVEVPLTLLLMVDLTGTPRWRGRALPRGVLVGVAAAVKLTPLVFVPYLLLTRQRRAALTAGGTFVGLSALMGVLTPSNSWSYWSHYVLDTSRIALPDSGGNESLHGALARLGLAPSTLVVLLLSTLVLGAGTLVAVEAERRTSPVLGVLVCAATGLMVSPLSWAHHYVWVIPLLAWLTLAPDRPRGSRAWAAGVALLYLWPPAWAGSGAPRHGGLVWFVGADAYFLSAVAFVVSGAVMVAWRARRGAPQPLPPPVPAPLRA